MDIKELNKTQLILLTLLITFVVSIATGIVTVTLMQQMPKAATQTINNVIQRTIEKVTTVQAPTKNSNLNLSDGSVLVSIYDKSYVQTEIKDNQDGAVIDPIKPLSQGVVISDSGLILVDSNTLNSKDDIFKVVLGSDLFDAKILKSFGNGFVILQIQSKSKTIDETKPTEPKADNAPVDLNIAPKQ